MTLKILQFQMKNYLCNPNKFRQIGSLLDKKERMNPNIQGSVKRNWMNFVLGVNIPPQKFLRLFDKEAGVKVWVSGFKFVLFPKRDSMCDC
jgi:hypothetical protein